jgi:hypothetical protein
MAQQEILREYLLALGFKMDNPGERNMRRVLGAVHKSADLTGKSILGLGASTVAMVTIFANQMQKLYYASQRSRETAGNLQAIAFGAKQIGLGGDQMIAAVEGMQRAIRLNPGLQGLLAQLGVDITKGPADQLKELVKVLGKMPSYVGSRFASMFGLDPDTLLQLQLNIKELEEAEQKRKDFAKALGIDTEAMAQAGKDYAKDLGEIVEKWGMVKDVISMKLLPYFKDMAGFTKDIADNLIRVIQGSKDLPDIGDKVLEAAGVKKVGGGVKLHGVDEPDTRPGWQRITQNAFERQSFWDFITKGPRKIQVDPWANIPKSVRKRSGTVTEPDSTSASAQMVLADTLGLKNFNPGNLRNWNGERKNQGFSVFGSFQEGLSAMAGNLAKYANQGWNTIKQIAEHWAPRSENDTEAYIKSLVKQLGVGADISLDLKDPETLRKVMGAIITNENGRNPFSPETLNAAIATRLGSPSVQLQQTTNIHMHGVTNPREAGHVAASQQERVNGDIVRDMRGAIR